MPCLMANIIIRALEVTSVGFPAKEMHAAIWVDGKRMLESFVVGFLLAKV